MDLLATLALNSVGVCATAYSSRVSGREQDCAALREELVRLIRHPRRFDLVRPFLIRNRERDAFDRAKIQRATVHTFEAAVVGNVAMWLAQGIDESRWSQRALMIVEAVGCSRRLLKQETFL